MRMVLLASLGLLAACNQSALPADPGDGGAPEDLARLAADLTGPVDFGEGPPDLAGRCPALLVDQMGALARAAVGGDYDPRESLTVEAWVWIVGEPFGEYGAVVAHGAAPGYSPGYAMVIDGKFSLTMRPGYAGNAIVPTGTWDKQWAHVAMVYDSAIATNLLFVDGRLVTKAGAHGGPMPAMASLDIGPGMQAFLSEVRVTAGSRYVGSFTPDARFVTDPYTLALFHLDEPSGTVAHDASGHGNDATLLGGAHFAQPPVCR